MEVEPVEHGSVAVVAEAHLVEADVAARGPVELLRVARIAQPRLRLEHVRNTAARGERFLHRRHTLAEHAPNLKRAIIHRQVITPKDIEDTIGLTEGNIFQGELALNQLFFLRPVPAWAKYRTPVRGFWQCGAGTHPGGGIMGASGRLAALEILGA